MRAQAFWVIFLPAMLLAACGESPEPESQKPDQGPSRPEVSDVIRDQVEGLGTAVCESAKDLKASVTTFLDSPTTETLIKARTHWRQAHQSYANLVLAYELAGHDPLHIEDDRDTLDASPILPGYLDRVPGYPRSGIVYSEVPLTPDFLREEHQSTDFLYLTLGFHPLETMLWGGTDQSAEERAMLYTNTESVPEDKVDSHARRVELLRLIAHGLNRDASKLCPLSGQEPLMTNLALLTRDEAHAKQAMARALETLIQPKLSAWQNNPEGEDRNGMPVWHAPFAKTDFTEMSAQVSALQVRWLPALVPNLPDTDSSQALKAQFSVLSERLAQHAETASNLTVDGITHTRDEFSVLIAALSPPPRLEEPAQSGTPADQADTKEQALGPLDSEESRE